MSAEAAQRLPAYTVESGPAAGAIAGAAIGNSLGYDKVISFDMGGTTAKACLIEKGEPRTATHYEVGGEAHGGHIIEGTGYPVLVPVLDLVEVGTGGAA